MKLNGQITIFIGLIVKPFFNLKLVSLLILIFLTFSAFAQNKLHGVVRSDDGRVLQYANLIGEPINTSSDTLVAHSDEIIFAISSVSGEYVVNIPSNRDYLITTSFLGFDVDSFYVSSLAFIDNVLERNIILTRSHSELPNVTVKGQKPIVIKKDTIRFNVEFFNKGNEDVLSDVLNNLPSVTVTKEGAVFINEERVSKLLVEGKLFFTGGTKLGVENIPANSIEGIEIIDNYNSNKNLVGISSSDEKVINVDLYDGKENILFGDVTKGGSNTNYKLHTNLFKFRPKISTIVIGDIQNVGESPLSIQEILDLKGGIPALLSSPQEFFEDPSLFKMLQLQDPQVESQFSKFIASDINIIEDEVETKLTGYYNKINSTEILSGSSSFSNQNSIFSEIFDTERMVEFSSGLVSASVRRKLRKRKTIEFFVPFSYSSINSVDMSAIDRFGSFSSTTRKTVRGNIKLKPGFQYVNRISDKRAIQLGVEVKIANNEANLRLESTNKDFFSGLYMVDTNEVVVHEEMSNKVDVNYFFKNHYNVSNYLKLDLGLMGSAGHHNNLVVDKLFDIGTIAGDEIPNFGSDFDITYNSLVPYLEVDYDRSKFKITTRFSVNYNNITRFSKFTKPDKIHLLYDSRMEYKISRFGALIVDIKREAKFLSSLMYNNQLSAVNLQTVSRGLDRLYFPIAEELSFIISKNSLFSSFNYSASILKGSSEDLNYNTSSNGFNVVRQAVVSKREYFRYSFFTELLFDWVKLEMNSKVNTSDFSFINNEILVEYKSSDLNIILNSKFYINNSFSSALEFNFMKSKNESVVNQNELVTMSIKEELEYFKSPFKIYANMSFVKYEAENQSVLWRSLFDMGVSFRMKRLVNFVSLKVENILNSNELITTRSDGLFFTESVVALLPRRILLSATLKF